MNQISEPVDVCADVTVVVFTAVVGAFVVCAVVVSSRSQIFISRVSVFIRKVLDFIYTSAPLDAANRIVSQTLVIMNAALVSESFEAFSLVCSVV